MTTHDIRKRRISWKIVGRFHSTHTGKYVQTHREKAKCWQFSLAKFAVVTSILIWFQFCPNRSGAQQAEIDDSLFDVPENYGVALLHDPEFNKDQNRSNSLEKQSPAIYQRRGQPASSTQSEWPNQILIGQFHFHSANKIEDQQRLANELTNLRLQLEKLTDCSLNLERIHIVSLGSHHEFQRYMKHYFPGAPDRRALFIKIGGPGIVFTFEHKDWLVDLRHEVTHALIHQRFPKIDLWLDEGIAEYFENENKSGDDFLTLSAPKHSDRLIPIRELFARDALWLAFKSNPNKHEEMSSNDYVKARDWATALINESAESRALLRQYFAGLQRKQKLPIPILIRSYLDSDNSLKINANVESPSGIGAKG